MKGLRGDFDGDKEDPPILSKVERDGRSLFLPFSVDYSSYFHQANHNAIVIFSPHD